MFVKGKVVYSVFLYLVVVALVLDLCLGQVDLGSMESWGFNGVSSDEVTLMSDKVMKIKNLEYTGEGPAAWFMVGKDEDDYTTEFTDLDGVIIPDESGGCDRLGRYRGDDIELTLPAGMKFSDYDYLSIYCIRFSHNFGYIPIKKGITFPSQTNDKCLFECLLEQKVFIKYSGFYWKINQGTAQAELDDIPGECDQNPERRGGGEDEEEEEEEKK